MASNNEIIQLQRQLLDYATSLFNEEYLNDHFTKLQELRTATNPDIVVNIVSNFFKDAEKTLNNLNTLLNRQPVDLNMADAYIYQLKGCSSSIGAQRFEKAIIILLNYFLQQNMEGCKNYLEEVYKEFYLVKSKLEYLFKLEQQLVAAGGLI